MLQEDIQGRSSLGSPISSTPPPGISSKVDRSPSVTPPEAWGGEAIERGGFRQPTMSRFAFRIQPTTFVPFWFDFEGFYFNMLNMLLCNMSML